MSALETVDRVAASVFNPQKAAWPDPFSAVCKLLALRFARKPRVPKMHPTDYSCFLLLYVLLLLLIVTRYLVPGTAVRSPQQSTGVWF